MHFPVLLFNKFLLKNNFRERTDVRLDFILIRRVAFYRHCSNIAITIAAAADTQTNQEDIRLPIAVNKGKVSRQCPFRS